MGPKGGEALCVAPLTRPAAPRRERSDRLLAAQGTNGLRFFARFRCATSEVAAGAGGPESGDVATCGG